MDNKLLKTNDAANYLGVSRSSLTNWIKQGQIAGGVTPGGHYRFTIEELDAFAAKRGLLKPDGDGTGTPRETSSGTRIAVVDDDEAFREFVRDALEEFTGFELKEAVDGMKGAMLIGSWKPNLIILDIRMPSMNGAELLRLVRENPELSTVQIIVASAHLSEELRAELAPWKPDIVLEKPVRLAKLVAAIQSLAELPLSQD